VSARGVRLLSLLLAVAGCGPMYFYGTTGSITVPSKDPKCSFELLTGTPPRSFDELGVVAPEDIEYGSLAAGSPQFADQIRPMVCAAGGDAVVAEQNQWGRYVRGTVIKYR
jgi:hypothetical protein